MSAAPRFTLLRCSDCQRQESEALPAARFSLCLDGIWRCNPCALLWTRTQGVQP